MLVLCRVPRCIQPVRVKRDQLCNAHWLRLRRHGSLQLHKPLRIGTRLERFQAKIVNRPCPRSDLDSCWEWMGARDSAGYGVINFGRNGSLGKPILIRAHIVAFWLHHGFVPQDAYICHHCDNPPCANPNHLYAGSARTNVHDMIRRGRAGRQVGHVREWADRKKLAQLD